MAKGRCSISLWIKLSSLATAVFIPWYLLPEFGDDHQGVGNQEDLAPHGVASGLVALMVADNVKVLSIQPHDFPAPQVT